ncbi:MAG: extradiol ring-cleavage dioxygenase [Firmicutes bacterium]|nr:extradiol ring-cleavage dioxygenase [Bacillota bacterium]
MTPHGSEIIEQLSGGRPELMRATRMSMERLGHRMAQASPTVIVVLTPHGVRVRGQFCIVDTERMFGQLEEQDACVTMERRVHRPLADAIAREAEGVGLPVARAGFATASGEHSCLPLDWGVIVPLHFMPHTKIVTVTPTRELTLEDHVRFGSALAQATASLDERVGLVASCDWAHAHAADGPYGYDPAAAQLDRQVADWISENNLEALTTLSPDFIAAAKPDGIWQALILAGAIPAERRRTEFLSYEVPTYFGLMCASFL